MALVCCISTTWAAHQSKGITIDQHCKIFEVCNPVQAEKVLSADMRLNMDLPCRISVFTENGSTKIGTIRPAQMIAILSRKSALAHIANEVEAKIIQMIDEAAATAD